MLIAFAFINPWAQCILVSPRLPGNNLPTDFFGLLKGNMDIEYLNHIVQKYFGEGSVSDGISNARSYSFHDIKYHQAKVSSALKVPDSLIQWAAISTLAEIRSPVAKYFLKQLFGELKSISNLLNIDKNTNLKQSLDHSLIYSSHPLRWKLQSILSTLHYLAKVSRYFFNRMMKF